MFMLVLVTVIGVVAGESTVPRCCAPPQWESIKAGIKSEIYGQEQNEEAQVEKQFVFSSYDQNSSQIAHNISVTLNGQTHQYINIIFDYRNRVQYVIDPILRTCIKSSILTPFIKSCLPAEATQDGDKFHYEVRNETIAAVLFTRSEGEFNITTTMRADSCLTVFQRKAYSNTLSGASMDSVEFFNYTMGIKDSSVFNPPGYCQLPIIG